LTDVINRPARTSLAVSVLFTADGVQVEGQSVNVSESGLLVNFTQPLDVWTSGELSLVVGEYVLSIHARVARVHDRSAGLSFLVDTDNDRLTIRIMVDYAAATPPEESVPSAV
jgi:hypothetical protein